LRAILQPCMFNTSFNWICTMAILASLTVALVAIYFFLAFRYQAADHSQYDTPVAPLVKPESEVSEQHLDVVATLNEYAGNMSLNIKVSRQQLEDLFTQEVDAEITPVDVAGIPSEWVVAEGAEPNKRLLYLHGGAFRVGSPKTHRYITSEISRRAGVSVLAIDYRMQPEFKTINCHEDARTAYQWILNHGPHGESSADHLFVAGDSAGGNMTLAVISWARDHGLRAADGAIALAPLTDASLSSPSWKTNLKTDPFLGPAIGRLIKVPRSIMAITSRYASGAAVNNPQLSPLLGDLSNLPATLIQVSKHEMLFDDAQRYANKAAASGSEVALQVWPRMVHVFQAFGPDLPEANDALDGVSHFVRSRMTKPKAGD